MPVYEYWCDEHGVFEATQSISAYKQPSACPICGAAAARVLLTAPGLGVSDRASIRAHDVNARAADSPKRLSQQGPGYGGRGGRSRGNNQKFTHANGTNSFPKQRPWMIGW